MAPRRRDAPARLRALDVLRAVAVLLVLGSHTPGWRQSPPWPLPRLFDLWRAVGWMGVDLFFVLSGFLVSGLLFREWLERGEIRFGRFFLRRGFKIYPAFYVFLAASVAMQAGAGLEVRPSSVLHEALFVQNYGRPLWAHTWSLAVEEHFYLLLPLGLVLLARRRPGQADPFRPILAAALLVAVSALALRGWAAWTRPFRPGLDAYGWNQAHYFRTHLRLDSLGFGVVLSYLDHFHGARLRAWVRGRRRLLAAAGAVFVLPAALLDHYRGLGHPTIGLTLLYVGFGFLLLLALDAPPPRGALLGGLLSALAALGYHSYSIYLWHLPVRAFLMDRWVARVAPALPYLAEQALYVALALGVGVAMARLVELPALRLRDRWFPSRSSSLGAGVAPAQRGATVVA